MNAGVHRTYRSPALLGIGLVGGVLAVLFAGWTVVDELGRGEPLLAVAAGLWGALAGVLIAEVFLRPAVATTSEGIVLVNPFRTVLVPWAQVRGVETELALQILTAGKRYTSWAATGNRKAAIRNRRERARLMAGGPQGTSRSPDMSDVLGPAGVRSITPPVECKIFIDAGHQAWQLERNTPTDTPTPRATWHLPSLVAVGALAVVLAAVTIAL